MKLPTWLVRLIGTLSATLLILFYPILAFRFRHRGRPGSARLFYRGILGIAWLCVLSLALYAWIWHGSDFGVVIAAIGAFIFYALEGLSTLNIISRLPKSTYDKI